MTSNTHSRGNSADRPPRPSSSSMSTPTPGSRPGVLEISLDRPNPLQTRPCKSVPPQLLNLLSGSNPVLSDFHPPSKSEAVSPKAKEDTHPMKRHKTHFEDDFPLPGDESLSSSDDEAPISHKMKALNGPKAYQRQATTVLRQSQRVSLTEGSQFTFADEFPIGSYIQKPAIETSGLYEQQNASRTSEPEKTTFDREKGKSLSEEVTRLRQENQKLRSDVYEERGKVQRVNETIATFEKLLASKDTDLQRMRLEAETARKEILVWKVRSEAAEKEIEALKCMEKAIRSEEERNKGNGKEVHRLREELVKAYESIQKSEQEVQHWKRKATQPDPEDASSSAKVETYLRELMDLKQILSSLETKNRDLTIAYKSLQKDHSALLECMKQTPNSPVFNGGHSEPFPSLIPKPEEKKRIVCEELTEKRIDKETIPDVILPEKPRLPDTKPEGMRPSMIASVRNTSAQMLTSLQLKMTKLQSERDTLQAALSSLIDTDTIQARGKKHSLEMELGMINSTLSLLSEKINRYMK